MNWYNKIRKIADRSLYHGTIIDHAPSIGEIGLFPSVGQFVQDAYGSEYAAAGLDIEEVCAELSFATDKENLGSAVNAMLHHIREKLGKSWGEGVSVNDIRNHGMLVKIKGCPGSTEPPSGWEQRPEEYDVGWEMQAEERGLHSVEPGDYYTEYPTGGAEKEYIELITGSALIRFLQRKGLLKKYIR